MFGTFIQIYDPKIEQKKRKNFNFFQKFPLNANAFFICSNRCEIKKFPFDEPQTDSFVALKSIAFLNHSFCFCLNKIHNFISGANIDAWLNGFSVLNSDRVN